MTPVLSTPPLLLLALLMLGAAHAANPEATMSTLNRVLMDFADDDSIRWYAVNDGVMGGLSQGAPTRKDGLLVFSGVLLHASIGAC